MTPSPAASVEPGAGWAGLYARHRYAILFWSLVFTLAIGPMLRELDVGDGVMEVFLGLNLLAAVLPLGSAKVRGALVALAVLAVLLRLATQPLDLHYAPSLSMLAWILVATFAAWGALRFVLTSTRVSTEHLCAALSVYLLGGLFWGVAFFALERLLPGSMLVGGAPVHGRFAMVDGVYYSFVTLATLGYGDIVPATPTARGLAIFEAVFGQLYLAVLVAGLVSLRLAARLEK